MLIPNTIGFVTNIYELAKPFMDLNTFNGRVRYLVTICCRECPVSIGDLRCRPSADNLLAFRSRMIAEFVSGSEMRQSTISPACKAVRIQKIHRQLN